MNQNYFHTNSCLYELSSAFIFDLRTARRVKHCYIVSYKLLSSNSYHHYFIQLRTHLHVYQNKTLFLLLLERKTSREATSKETWWYGQFVSRNMKMLWEKTIHVSASPNVASWQRRCLVPLKISDFLMLLCQ